MLFCNRRMKAVTVLSGWMLYAICACLAGESDGAEGRPAIVPSKGVSSTNAQNPQAFLEPRASSKSAELALAADGKAQVSIVVAVDASEKIKALAQELAEYLKRISGAEFKIAAGDGKTGIVLGTIGQFPNTELQPSLEIRNLFDGIESYAIRSEKGRLLLLGATELGVSHAAFRFLESMGCRWFFPAPEWEVLPRRDMLKVNIDEASRPAILSRNIWYGYGLFNEPGLAYSKMRPALHYENWKRHNRMAQSMQIGIGHAWGTIITQFRSEFEKNPEYLALVKGKRQTLDTRLDELNLCTGSPGLQKLVGQYAVEYFQKYPQRDMVSVEPSDGSNHCECEKCQALGSVSNRVFTLANVAARAVAQKYPGKMVGLYAYNKHSVPPSFDLEPNVYVELTAGFNQGEFTFPELMELWSKKSKNMGYYLYFSVWNSTHDSPPGQLGADVKQLQEWIAKFHAHGAVSITAESSNNWAVNGRGYYIANKLMLEPNAPVKELLDDFYLKAFGAGAKAMQRFWERLDPGNKPAQGRQLLAEAFRDLEEADSLTKDDPPVQMRLDHLKQYLHYVHLDWVLNTVPKTEKEKRKELTIGVLTWAYRTRYSYMAHWMAMQQAWAKEASLEFAEPGWHIASKEKKPWFVEAPVTREETERCFREGLKYFQVQKVQRKDFSTDMVPVVFRGDRPEFLKPAGSSELYQGGPRYLLYSITGEAIEVDVTPGFLPAYRNRPPARYVLSSSDGREIVNVRMPLDNQKRSLKLAVPQAGLYYLDFSDSAAGWRLEAEPGRVATIQLEAGRRIASMGNLKTMYFYVPKGTPSVDFYFKGYRFNMLDAAGKIIFAVPTSQGEYFSVKVPAGQDGKLWSMTGFAFGYFSFFNVPNYIAASPSALLVPREVAVKDGLELRR